MYDLLNDRDTYDIIKTDPTSKVDRNCHNFIDDIFYAGCIDDKTRKRLKINTPIPPRIYGLPKLHKNGIPLRPIVSTINSPAYQLSKYCASILKPLVSNSEYNVKNSLEFKKFVNNVVLKEDDVLVSFDVKSLFTNIPLQKARECIIDRWSDLKGGTKLNQDMFLLMLDLCITQNNYFQFKGQNFKQKFGLAMGNPLSPILADIVLDDLFKQKIAILKRKPTFIKKYVDDIILAMPQSYINETHKTLETYHPKIRFTVEIEEINRIPFLDIMLHRRSIFVITDWYRKTATSERMINYFSSHPHKIKRNTVTELLGRVWRLSDDAFKGKSLDKARSILLRNNYPLKMIEDGIRKIKYTKTRLSTGEEDNTDQTQPSVFGALTYVQGLTESITKAMKPENQKTLISHKINNKLQSAFTNLKDKIPATKREGLIYNIPCRCGCSYVGETSKTLQVRKSQHICDVRNMHKREGGSALVVHARVEDHEFNFDAAKVIAYEPKTRRRKFKEACHIWMTKKAVNYKVDTQHLQSSYRSIIQLQKNANDSHQDMKKTQRKQRDDTTKSTTNPVILHSNHGEHTMLHTRNDAPVDVQREAPTTNTNRPASNTLQTRITQWTSTGAISKVNNLCNTAHTSAERQLIPSPHIDTADIPRSSERKIGRVRAVQSQKHTLHKYFTRLKTRK